MNVFMILQISSVLTERHVSPVPSLLLSSALYKPPHILPMNPSGQRKVDFLVHPE